MPQMTATDTQWQDPPGPTVDKGQSTTRRAVSSWYPPRDPLWQ
jgi:hypothetical protein